MTYWAINAVFLGLTAIVAVVAAMLVRTHRRTGIRLSSLLVAMVVVLLLTAVFDNVMIRVGLVGYEASKISGAFVGVAPLEDFAYAVAAVVLLPALWVIVGPRLDARVGSGG